MPDGSYPIRSAKDVENAVRDYDRSGQKADVKAHIIARAKAIGAESALPDDWARDGREGRRPAPPPASAAQAPEALAKAAAALTQAALKLERAARRERAPAQSARRLSRPRSPNMKKRVAALEAQPLPAKAALRAVAKTRRRRGRGHGQRRRRRPAPGLAASSRARARADQAQPRQSR